MEKAFAGSAIGDRKSLFQMNLVAANLEEVLESHLRDQESACPRRDRLLPAPSPRGAFDHQEEIDGRIRDHLHRWDYSRVGNVEKTITLASAVFELLHCNDTPTKVIINEAIELAKESSRPSSRCASSTGSSTVSPARRALHGNPARRWEITAAAAGKYAPPS